MVLNEKVLPDLTLIEYIVLISLIIGLSVILRFWVKSYKYPKYSDSYSTNLNSRMQNTGFYSANCICVMMILFLILTVIGGKDTFGFGEIYTFWSSTMSPAMWTVTGVGLVFWVIIVMVIIRKRKK